MAFPLALYWNYSTCAASDLFISVLASIAGFNQSLSLLHTQAEQPENQSLWLLDYFWIV